MTRRALDAVKAPQAATLRDVLATIDRSGQMVALLVDDTDRLVGLLTDGDVRRALLGGAALPDPALPFATTRPQTVAAGSGRALVLDLMRALRISAIPELDADGRVLGLHTLSDVVGVEPLPTPAVVMAGGRGTRLGTLTREMPKPLVEVAGRPILEWIILNLVGGGVHELYVSVNHLAEQIEERLGDGARFGCNVTYLREDPQQPLGTAGSLGLFRTVRPDLDVPLLVMNGDLMVQFQPEDLVAFHDRVGAEISVATRAYQHEIPFGVVGVDGDWVRTIEEKPTVTREINAGVYALAPSVLDLVRPEEPSTMPQLIQACLDTGKRVAAWQLQSDWIDVGTPADLARANGRA
ncbi:MAG TPA: sugar phosphate nucleotidyltransferase [Jatrophihabitans sp.]|nr:sugar phosphate nucleotidyltransferase [Jatrophihabitans sp.]